MKVSNNSTSSGESELKQYRIDLSYVGTDFLGWQSQPSGGAVQDHLEAALMRLLNRERVPITGASRTDTGVHAKMQVASFRLDSDVNTERLLSGFNALLPQSIGVQSVSCVAGDFHPIYSALEKSYCYRLWQARYRDPFTEPYTHGVNRLDLSAMKKASRALIGTHDFTSFCASDSSAQTKIRELYDIEFRESGALLEIWFRGKGFLKQMVRSLTGTLIEVGAGRRNAESMASLLSAKDRRLAGPTAPAKGLTLEQIKY